jgi:hypothetical protein
VRCILLASLASCVCGLHSGVTTHSCLIGSLEASWRWVDAWKLVEGTIYAFIPVIRIVFPWTPAQCRTTVGQYSAVQSYLQEQLHKHHQRPMSLLHVLNPILTPRRVSPFS